MIMTFCCFFHLDLCKHHFSDYLFDAKVAGVVFRVSQDPSWETTVWCGCRSDFGRWCNDWVQNPSEFLTLSRRPWKYQGKYVRSISLPFFVDVSKSKNSNWIISPQMGVKNRIFFFKPPRCCKSIVTKPWSQFPIWNPRPYTYDWTLRVEVGRMKSSPLSAVSKGRE